MSMLNCVSCIPYDFVRQADPKDVKLINAVLELVDFGELELQGESLQALPLPAPSALPGAPVVGCSADLSTQIVPATAELGAELPILDEFIADKILLSSVLKEAKPWLSNM